MIAMIAFIRSNVKLWALLSLTLGLAPFFPEPHVWGKILWVMGGAVGMGHSDWFDLLMHGTPWVLLMVSGLLHFRKEEGI